MVLHTFNPSSQEIEAGGTLSSKPAMSTEQIPGQTRATGRNPLSENQIKSSQISPSNNHYINTSRLSPSVVYLPWRGALKLLPW